MPPRGSCLRLLPRLPSQQSAAPDHTTLEEPGDTGSGAGMGNPGPSGAHRLGKVTIWTTIMLRVRKASRLQKLIFHPLPQHYHLQGSF